MDMFFVNLNLHFFYQIHSETAKESVPPRRRINSLESDLRTKQVYKEDWLSELQQK